jgi:hypothetical protein
LESFFPRTKIDRRHRLELCSGIPTNSLKRIRVFPEDPSQDQENSEGKHLLVDHFTLPEGHIRQAIEVQEDECDPDSPSQVSERWLT